MVVVGDPDRSSNQRIEQTRRLGRYARIETARRRPAAHPHHVDMRWPVNPRSLTVLSADASVHAGGHMGTALDHADIRGFQPHISVGPEPASH